MTRNVPALLREPSVDVDELARELEQMRAYHDTWRPCANSYLAYLRTRLIVARELLADNGSIFVQVWDRNLCRVRIVMIEI
jgi:adenine-specific DNA-methyltransferase